MVKNDAFPDEICTIRAKAVQGEVGEVLCRHEESHLLGGLWSRCVDSRRFSLGSRNLPAVLAGRALRPNTRNRVTTTVLTSHSRGLLHRTEQEPE